MRRRAVIAAGLLALGGGAPATASAGGWTGWVEALRGDVHVTAEELTWGGVAATGLDVPVVLEGAGLRVIGGRFEAAGGRVRFDLHHEPRAGSSLHARGEYLEPGRHPALADWVSGVPLSLELSLEARGATLAALARTANGRVTARSSGTGRLLTGDAGAASAGGPVARLLEWLTPFGGDLDARRVECLALDWLFVDGRAEAAHGVELLTPRIRVTGGGYIDLGAGELSIRVTPRARSGVDPARLAVAESVVVAGSLAAPQLRAEPANVLGRAATLGTDAIATLSGARLLGLGGSAASPETLCGRAVE